jgi:hypothetical protein
MTLAINSPVTPYINFVLNSEDPNGNPVVENFKLVYDYRAIRRAEEELGIDLKDWQQWKHIKSSQTPALVYCGLMKFHPDVTKEHIEETLNPDVQGPLQQALFDMFFPGVSDKIKAALAEQGKGESKNGDAVGSAA